LGGYPGRQGHPEKAGVRSGTFAKGPLKSQAMTECP
jgi:hypothetical protein